MHKCQCYMLQASTEQLLEMDMQHDFEEGNNWRVSMCICGVRFVFFNTCTPMVDFLCSQSAVTLLPYRDTAELRGRLVGRGKRKEEQNAPFKSQLVDS